MIMWGLESQNSFQKSLPVENKDIENKVKEYEADLEKLKGLAPRKLEIDNELIKLDNNVLPGIVKNISVNQDLMYDEEEIPGKSGRQIQIKGYGNASISINIYIFNQYKPVDLLTVADLNANYIKSNAEESKNVKLSSSKYEQLKELEQAFKKIDDKGLPVIYKITNKHINTRGVKKCLFSKLDSSEDISGLDVNITFIECDMVIEKKQEQKKEQDTGKKATYKTQPENKFDDESKKFKSILETKRGR
ncbi:MAG TPA: hypothetical protein PK771_01530 [Spirochaetota bacterium]|nr:hypothetical protein [Spirochaetota bacterium]